MSHSLESMFTEMVQQNASDLYLTVGVAPSLRVGDHILPLGAEPLEEGHIRQMVKELVSEDQLGEFESTLELNTAYSWKNEHRFRLNLFRQQQQTGMVIRRVRTDIPTVDSLRLSPVYKQLIMEKRGLVLVIGATDSGKTTSIAAMIGHRNTHGSGHVITIEDPIEFVHKHQGCIFTQRDVGIDTYSFSLALKNALRQRPDIVMIGEIRDRDAMEHAILFSETGHLCIATLHANNASQAIERIISFFPEEKHHQILLSLSFHLKGILGQRLVENKKGGRSVAMEVLLNRGLIKALIEEGKIKQIREVLEKNHDGMVSFDQAVVALFLRGEITEEVAVAESDNPANVRLAIKQALTGSRTGLKS